MGVGGVHLWSWNQQRGTRVKTQASPQKLSLFTAPHPFPFKPPAPYNAPDPTEEREEAALSAPVLRAGLFNEVSTPFGGRGGFTRHPNSTSFLCPCCEGGENNPPRDRGPAQPAPALRRGRDSGSPIIGQVWDPVPCSDPGGQGLVSEGAGKTN